jgi:hypothetical protein
MNGFFATKSVASVFQPSFSADKQAGHTNADPRLTGLPNRMESG